jgi:hypothetical protein
MKLAMRTSETINPLYFIFPPCRQRSAGDFGGILPLLSCIHQTKMTTLKFLNIDKLVANNPDLAYDSAGKEQECHITST